MPFKGAARCKSATKIFMKKFSLLIMLCLFTASQIFAQLPQILQLDLSQPTTPASFILDANNVWTETYNDADYPFIEFNNSTFRFTHLGAGEGDSYGGYYWDGFTYSKNADNTDLGSSGNWINNQWGNMAGGGIKTDTEGNVLKDENGIIITDPDIPYLLAQWADYMEGAYTYPVLSVIFNDVYQAEGVYVNNSPWSYYGNLSGDGFARALDQNDDYFKLFIHGLDENYENNGKSVEYYLAKYENGELIQSPNWEWIDLSELGEIAGIYFTMESTDNSSYGMDTAMNTAAYFCIDKLQVSVPGEIGINIINKNISKIYPTVTTGLVHIVLPETVTDFVQIIDISGKVLQTVRLQSLENTIDISSYQAGIYMIRIGSQTVKVIKHN